MSIIQYQEASYACHVRDQLELAGCETRIAAVVSRAVGELIDHVARAQDDIRRDIQEAEFHASERKSELIIARRESFDRFIGTTIFVMAAAVVCGVLIAVFR